MPLKLQHDEIPALNLTSMIDVLFLLIIFFMVATKFDEFERNIDVAVPEVQETGDSSQPAMPKVVNVFADGRFELDGQSVTEEELVGQLTTWRKGRADSAVILRGDANCPYQHVATALAACRRANILDIGITVRLAGAPAGGPVR